jgi:heme oxygenase
MSCPYAFASNADNDGMKSFTKEQEDQTRLSQQQQQQRKEQQNEQSSPIPSSPTVPLTPIQALQLAKSSCPAFKAECPFRHVNDAQSMKKALERLPPSHVNASTSTDSTESTTDEESFINEINGESTYTSTSANSTHNNNGGTIINQSLRIALQHVHTVSQELQSYRASNSSSSKNGTNHNNNNNNNHHHDPTNHHVDVDGTVAIPTVNHVSLDNDYQQHQQQQQQQQHFRSMSLLSNTSYEKYEIAGGICPLKTLNPNNSFNAANNTKGDEGNENLKFVTQMDDLSFNAILAQLISKQQEENKEQYGAETAKVRSSTMNDTTPSISPTNNISSSDPAAASTTKATTGGMKKSKSNTSLSTALKVGTAKSHSSAESVHFVKEFIQGNINESLYSILISHLFWVYKSLEEELEIHAPTEFPSLHKRELYRRKSLQDDLEFFYSNVEFDESSQLKSNCNSDGDDEKERLLKMKIPPSQATIDYIQRIKFIAEKEPLLLLSHAYTRYLGDLSGGKVLARVAKRALNLKSDGDSNDDVIDGLAFYHFSEIESAKKFKDEYRFALDNLDHLSEEQIERLVAEANVAFVLNMRIFEELDVLGDVPGSSIRDLGDATCYYEDCIKRQANRKSHNNVIEVQYNDTDDNGVESECPFARFGGPNPHQIFKGGKEEEASTRHPGGEPNTKADVEQLKDHIGRCPWPFIFFHDVKAGMQDWQTWCFFGIVMCYLWNLLSAEKIIK